MKRFFSTLSFFSALLLAACSNSNTSGTRNKKGVDHSAHQNKSPVKQVGDKGKHESHAVDNALFSVVAAPNKVVISDQVSALARVVDTVIPAKGYGYITWDTRRSKKIAARTGGRVERLFVKYNNQYVRKGEKIMELYTPEINTYAAEYLHHLTTPGDESLLVKAREKLSLLGVSDDQLRQLDRSGFVSSTLSIYSPFSGYVLFDAETSVMPSWTGQGSASGGSEMNGGMESSTRSSQTSFNGAAVQGQLREGMYVNRNQTLFYINDFSTVWGVLSFDETTQPLLKTGMHLVVKSELLDIPLRGTISFIEPSFNNAAQKFMQVRTYLPNRNRELKINSLIEGTVNVTVEGKIIIPASAIFSLGKRKVVWVKSGITANRKNIFEIREVQIILMDKNIAVVSSGLSTSEEVAVEAGYLLDSQSLIEQ